MARHALPGHFASRTNEEATGMRIHALAIGAAAAALAVTACSEGGNDNRSAQTPQAQKAAGTQTISAGLAANSRFMAAAKAAGLDQTLAGPGPYTVFVPEDPAFDKAPAGTFDAAPANRARVTGIITNLILPGTVLVEDIGKAIERGKGKAVIGTMGGGTLTFTREGQRTIVTDSAGSKAAITKGDENFTNGVVHRIDAVLMPGEQQGQPPAVGQQAG
jgi:uncharacterized surface protein with fasciclin (FAS1) repeats